MKKFSMGLAVLGLSMAQVGCGDTTDATTTPPAGTDPSALVDKSMEKMGDAAEKMGEAAEKTGEAAKAAGEAAAAAGKAAVEGAKDAVGDAAKGVGDAVSPPKSE